MTHHQREKIYLVSFLPIKIHINTQILTHPHMVEDTKTQKYINKITHLFDVNLVNEENSFVSFSKTHYHHRLILHYYSIHYNE